MSFRWKDNPGFCIITSGLSRLNVNKAVSKKAKETSARTENWVAVRCFGPDDFFTSNNTSERERTLSCLVRAFRWLSATDRRENSFVSFLLQKKSR